MKMYTYLFIDTHIHICMHTYMCLNIHICISQHVYQQHSFFVVCARAHVRTNTHTQKTLCETRCNTLQHAVSSTLHPTLCRRNISDTATHDTLQPLAHICCRYTCRVADIQRCVANTPGSFAVRHDYLCHSARLCCGWIRRCEETLRSFADG